MSVFCHTSIIVDMTHHHEKTALETIIEALRQMEVARLGSASIVAQRAAISPLDTKSERLESDP